MLRLLHTSDWHLGHTLHGLPREAEHARFLAWLEETVVAEAVDALLVTGDVFDTATPPASAERALFDLLARLRARAPGLDVLIVGGNHDGPARLEAPAALLRGLGVRVVASLGRRPGAPLDPDRVVVPLHDRAGRVAAWVAAVPFLRPADLPARPRDAQGAGDAGAGHAAGVAAVYAEALGLARTRRGPDQALLATGHLTVRGAQASGDSERPLLGGLAALDADALFPDDVAYVALGHLHLAQAVGGREAVRYAGSPLPLSLAEADYRHQVLRVDLDGARLARVEARPVPRTVDVVRLPADGPRAADEVLPLLAALPPREALAPGAGRPLLEVRVRLAAPDPGLRRRVEEALEGKAARLVRLSVTSQAALDEPATLADAAGPRPLHDLDPRDVLVAAWRREREADPPADVLAAFDELLAGPAGAEAAAPPAAVAPAGAAPAEATPVAVPEGAEAA